MAPFSLGIATTDDFGVRRIDDLKKLPRRPAGETQVDVRLTYDLSGLRKKRLAAMSRLKVHPRDHLPNPHTRAQADALHVELSGDRRAYLMRTISEFEAALESQDPERIEAMRMQLMSVIEQLRPEDVAP